MSAYKQQRNGYIGEERSRALIPKDFWVLTRSVDAEAADLMVQNEYRSPEDARANRGQPLQVVSIQAKFFEGSNQVNIAKAYVLNENKKPRKGFLAFLHTDDEDEDHVRYIFTARDIVEQWDETEDKENYYFSLKAGRTYADFRNTSARKIRARLKESIEESTQESMSWAWSKASETYSSVRHPACLEPKYRLIKIGRAAVALFEGGYGQLGHPLEPRKDVYPYFGTYEWGYLGSGPKLLAASLLTHFLCGRRPEHHEIDKVLDYLVGALERDKEARFGKEEIFKALACIPFDANIAELAEVEELYLQVSLKYAMYFQSPADWSEALEQPASADPADSESDAPPQAPQAS